MADGPTINTVRSHDLERRVECAAHPEKADFSFSEIEPPLARIQRPVIYCLAVHFSDPLQATITAVTMPNIPWIGLGVRKNVAAGTPRLPLAHDNV
jgi:hypothetical protein